MSQVDKPRKKVDPKCYFESEKFAESLARKIKQLDKRGEISVGTPADFKKTMDNLLETGASRPKEVSMSDWYYMRDHGKKCPRCAERYIKLAAESKADCPGKLF